MSDTAKQTVLRSVPDALKSDDLERSWIVAELLKGTNVGETLSNIRRTRGADYVRKLRAYVQMLKTELDKLRREGTVVDWEVLEKEHWFVSALLLYVETAGRGEDAVTDLFLEVHEIPGEFVTSAEEHAKLLHIEALHFQKGSQESNLRSFAARALDKLVVYAQAGRPPRKGFPQRLNPA